MRQDRDQRRGKILELVTTQTLRTQDELAEALDAEGLTVAQSTLSRDIAALGLIKVQGAYRRPPLSAAGDGNPDEQWIAEGVLRVNRAGDHLAVLHTLPGDASSVARALDRLAWPDIIGTLAGDDTIFVALRDAGTADRVTARLRRLRKRADLA